MAMLHWKNASLNHLGHPYLGGGGYLSDSKQIVKEPPIRTNMCQRRAFYNATTLVLQRLAIG